MKHTHFITLLTILYTLNLNLYIYANPSKEDEITVENFMKLIENSSKEEQIDALLLQANEALLSKNYTLAIAYAQYTINLDPYNTKSTHSAKSIIRIAQVQLNQEETASVNWSTENNIIDKNRYLLLLGLSLENYNFKWQDNPLYARAGIGLNIEAFLPFYSNRFGFSFNYHTQFIDFRYPNLASDFISNQYNIFFIWRTQWRIPTLEISSTIALKFGISSQYLLPMDTNMNKNKEANLPSKFILPKFTIALNDKFFYYFIPNNFTKNLFLNFEIGLEWLSFQDPNESIALEFSIGMLYHFNSFSIGPLYQFRYHRLIREERNLLHNQWAIIFNYTI